MVLAIGLLVVGAVVLTVGAETAIRGAGRLAKALGVSQFLLGALLFGVDLESLGAALIAAGRGQTAIAAGEAFGTVVFLFSIAFGAALLLAPAPVQAPSRMMTLAPMITLLAGALAISDQAVDRLEGGALVVMYGLYVLLLVRDEQAARARGEEIEREAEEGPGLPAPVLLLGGLALVYVGAFALVGGGVRILQRTGLTAGFVGAAVIGTLASLDEVLLEVLPVRRGMSMLATGNLFGTVAAFTTGVLGLAALVRPLSLDAAAGSAFLFAAGLYALVATAFVARGKAGKMVGVVVLASYGAWLVVASRI